MRFSATWKRPEAITSCAGGWPCSRHPLPTACAYQRDDRRILAIANPPERAGSSELSLAGVSFVPPPQPRQRRHHSVPVLVADPQRCVHAVL
jgi:hypothetical protein